MGLAGPEPGLDVIDDDAETAGRTDVRAAGVPKPPAEEKDRTGRHFDGDGGGSFGPIDMFMLASRYDQRAAVGRREIVEGPDGSHHDVVVAADRIDALLVMQELLGLSRVYLDRLGQAELGSWPEDTVDKFEYDRIQRS
ncbi:MAG TPA: hypothetical protein VHC49_24360 [Mycobacteriales bacterium]|nr:hypothetical protein [Mycobacteriales bacterium]